MPLTSDLLSEFERGIHNRSVVADIFSPGCRHYIPSCRHFLAPKQCGAIQAFSLAISSVVSGPKMTGTDFCRLEQFIYPIINLPEYLNHGLFC